MNREGPGLERLLVVWCPDLLEQQEHGREARAFTRVLAAVGVFSPCIDVPRPGSCAVPTRGPSRYFGGDKTLANLVARALTSVERVDLGLQRTGPPGRVLPDAGNSGLEEVDTVTAGVGVADGLFAATLAARSALHDPSRGPVIVVPGGTPRFLAPWPVALLDRPELADLLCRLGIRTLGAFAGLPARRVLARFGTDGAICRAVAAGTEGELPGLRLYPRVLSVPRVPRVPRGHRLPRRPTAEEESAALAVPARQSGFFGGAVGTEARAAKAVTAVQRLLHPETVVQGRLQGGRGPVERARLVPWSTCGDTFRPDTFPRKRPSPDSDGDDTHRRSTFPRKRVGASTTPPAATSPPWPGQLPAPSPVIVIARKLPAELLDAAGRSVAVSGGGIASAAPARLSVAGGPWSEVVGWAGPWPSDERWWSKRGRSRQARLQVVPAVGPAYLLACRHGWWVEGIYD
jgi:protein ImuB